MNIFFDNLFGKKSKTCLLYTSERFISISDFASLVNIVIFFFWGLVDEDCLSKKALKYWLSFMPVSYTHLDVYKRQI